MKLQWILGLLATAGAVLAAPSANDSFGLPTPRFDNRTTGPTIHPLPESDGGCNSQPQPKRRFYNSVTRG